MAKGRLALLGLVGVLLFGGIGLGCKKEYSGRVIAEFTGQTWRGISDILALKTVKRLRFYDIRTENGIEHAVTCEDQDLFDYGDSVWVEVGSRTFNLEKNKYRVIKTYDVFNN